MAAVVVGEEEEEVSLGVIMTNTDIKFHILFFTLRSSSVSQSLSFKLLQSFYCPLSSVLALCLQISGTNRVVKQLVDVKRHIGQQMNDPFGIGSLLANKLQYVLTLHLV